MPSIASCRSPIVSITVTAFKWVPPFAQGNVRDHRIRWVLNEVGWPYQCRLIDTADQLDPSYLARQPFGQVPVLEETGRPPLFETGAIVLDVAQRAGKLLPADEGQRALAISWLFAALNSVEPYLSNLAEVDFFIEDAQLKTARRPGVVKAARQRLEQLATALGEREYLVGDSFTIADLMTASVLKIVGHTDLLDDLPNLLAYRNRCLGRPAYLKAVDDQCAEIARHSPADMKYELRQGA
jgi:glutathione S-transferase